MRFVFDAGDLYVPMICTISFHFAPSGTFLAILTSLLGCILHRRLSFNLSCGRWFRGNILCVYICWSSDFCFKLEYCIYRLSYLQYVLSRKCCRSKFLLSLIIYVMSLLLCRLPIQNSFHFTPAIPFQQSESLTLRLSILSIVFL